MNLSTFKVPSAWVPLAMSGMALAVVMGRLLIAGAARETDEGAAAHVWQLLMVGQVPVIAWFLFQWFPKDRKAASAVTVAQIAAGILAAAPVVLLGL